jgi:hypothetical protein
LAAVEKERGKKRKRKGDFLGRWLFLKEICISKKKKKKFKEF